LPKFPKYYCAYIYIYKFKDSCIGIFAKKNASCIITIYNNYTTLLT
jgi:hypothetical protein